MPTLEPVGHLSGYIHARHKACSRGRRTWQKGGENPSPEPLTLCDVETFAPQQPEQLPDWSWRRPGKSAASRAAQPGAAGRRRSSSGSACSGAGALAGSRSLRCQPSARCRTSPKGPAHPIELVGELDKPASDGSLQSSEAVLQAIHLEVSGPLPHPQVLARYDEVVPGGAERIVKLAENQVKHRQTMQSRGSDLYFHPCTRRPYRRHWPRCPRQQH
jgi:hypothetical protein